ncbi:Gfo/Idh/MocA family oxidoreductase [Rhizobium sp. CRIBSB]|nr:Gfo/Idh/MocA family oxidoreductase [Rhizobium sp. CRIBSB]
MTLAAPVRWGVLGVAGIAVNRVIPAMQAADGCEVVAIGSRSLEKARAAAEALGVARAYGGYQDLLDDPEIDAVYIPLPNTLHVEWSERALAAGKHVLCEKPVAMNAAQAHRLIKARDASGLCVEEGFPFINHPQWTYIRQVLREERIGRARAITGVLAYNNRNPDDLRNNPDEGGGGLYDIGCYLINAVRIAFGAEPRRAIGLFEDDPEFGVDRLTSFILEFEQGHANLTVTTQGGPTTGGTHQHFGVVGERGWLRAEFPFSHSTASPCSVFLGDELSRGSIPTHEERFPVVNQYQLQAERFSRLVRGLPAEPWPIENGVANMRVLDALFRSGTSGHWEVI